MNLKEYIDGVNSGNLSPEIVCSEYFQKAKDSLEKNEKVYLRINNQMSSGIEDEGYKNNKGILKGAPIAIKDNIMQKGEISTCGSKILQNYVAPYTATCVKNLEKNGGIVLGKTNMDEFAMGSSNETSYYGPVLNPYGTNRIPGGSSGGSAVAIAKDLCLGALGTDTAGSVRVPAAFCGVVGFKPTYGRISRYGVQSMASSFDQVGTLTKTVDDTEILLKAIMGFDEKDSQSDERANILEPATKSINEYKIALPKQCFSEGLDQKIKERILFIVENLKGLGVEINEIDLPVLEAGIAVYYTLMPAELSTNLSRFDGIRFGLQGDTALFENIHEYYKKIRAEGFGEEAKRRILLGTYVLSSANYEGYYLKALKVKAKLVKDLDDVFQKYDLILTPTAPTVARKIGEKMENPVQMYLSDMYTLPANLAGLPAISIPVGIIEDRGENMPVGLHLMANKWKESDLFSVGKCVENIATKL